MLEDTERHLCELTRKLHDAQNAAAQARLAAEAAEKAQFDAQCDLINARRYAVRSLIQEWVSRQLDDTPPHEQQAFADDFASKLSKPASFLKAFSGTSLSSSLRSGATNQRPTPSRKSAQC